MDFGSLVRMPVPTAPEAWRRPTTELSPLQRPAHLQMVPLLMRLQNPENLRRDY